MAEKELRHMNRGELIDVIYALKQQQEALEAENNALKGELSRQELKIKNAGSIAEAALALSGVFEAAQTAADQYLASIRASCGSAEEMANQILSDAKTEAQKTLTDARQQAEEIRASASAYEAQVNAQCEELKCQAEAETKARWDAFERKVGDLFMSYQYGTGKGTW